MASCLGISVGKNLIKYAKVSKDKNSASTKIEAYGVKFYDVLSQTLNEIIQETKSADAEISVSLTSDFYQNVQCFKSMNKKEKAEFLHNQFEDECQKRGVSPANFDVRYVFADDPSSPDSDKVMCVGVSKVELTNLWQALSNNKLTSISGVGPTTVNLFKDKAEGQNCLIVNIEDETKLTLIKFGKISELINIPVGMDEVITRLADKYNSYAKAYQACKGVDAYSDSDYSLDTESQSIRDALMPTLYDLKQRIIMACEPFMSDFSDVYVTGTGIIVNNIDLYLSEAFPGKKVDLLLPYFVNKERSSLKDVLEVNSALAAALNSLGGIKKDEDFLYGDFLKADVNKKQFSPQALFAKAKEKIDELNKKTLKVRKSSKKKKKIEFDSDVEQLQQLGGAGETAAVSSDDGLEYYDPISEWLTRIAISLFASIVAYSIVASIVQGSINAKLDKVRDNTAKTNLAIEQVKSDRDEVQKQADAYKSKVADLEKVIGLARMQREQTYDVPNFMSQLMFIIPVDVRVTAISIGTNDNVIVEAQSGRYAQLGYFVSRLKLAGILKDVGMEVVDMTSDIKIKVNGVLP